MTTLNIRASGLLQNPDANTPVLSSVGLQSLVTVDARYLNFAENAEILSIVGSGVGSAVARTLNQVSTTLGKPIFKKDDGNYIYLNNAFLGTGTLSGSDLISEPLTLVYVAKINWAVQQPTALAAGNSRLVSIGGTATTAHRVIPTSQGVAVQGSGTGGSTPTKYLNETPNGWFCHLLHWNNGTLKTINMTGQLTQMAVTASSPADRIVVGAAASGSTSGAPDSKLKYFAVRSGALTDAELLALHSEIRLMFDL